MKRGRAVSVVWDNGDGIRSMKGHLISDDDILFIKMQLADGTQLSIAKNRIIKLEKPA